MAKSLEDRVVARSLEDRVTEIEEQIAGLTELLTDVMIELASMKE